MEGARTPAAVAFLRGLEEIQAYQIGLMGVSQNGWTPPLAAAESDAVAFTVIVAGPTVSLGEEVYWNELAGGANTIFERKREELSEQMAALDGPVALILGRISRRCPSPGCGYGATGTEVF